MGKLVEKQGRKAMDLRKPASMTAKLLFRWYRNISFVRSAMRKSGDFFAQKCLKESEK